MAEGSRSPDIRPGGQPIKREPRYEGRERQFPEKPVTRFHKPETRLFSPHVEISFDTAKQVAQIVAPIQDEKGIVVSSEEISRIKGSLREAGMDAERVTRMSPAEVVVSGQRLLRQAEVEIPEAKTLEAKVTRRQVEQTRGTDEEKLTVGKVKAYLTVEEFEEASETGGPGAMEVANWTDQLPDPANLPQRLARYVRAIREVGENPRSVRSEMSRLEKIEESMQQELLRGTLREVDPNVQRARELLSGRIELLIASTSAAELIRQMEPTIEEPTRRKIDRIFDLIKTGETTGDNWDAAWADLDRDIERIKELVEEDEPSGYKFAYFVCKAVENDLRAHKDLEDNLPDEAKTTLRYLVNKKDGLLSQLNQKFRKKFEALSEEDKISLVGDIDREANTFLKQIIGGYGRGVEEAKAYLLGMVGEDPTGLREWRVVKSLEGIDNAVRIHQLTEIPVIWEEVPERIANIYAFIESTDFSIDELSITINKAISLLERVPLDTVEGQKMRQKLVDQLESMRAFHSFRIAMERGDMNPEDVIPQVKNYFTNETWKDFVDRFGADIRGRQFTVIKRDAEGNVVVDAEGNPVRHKVNLFDEAQKLYFGKLQEERRRLNKIEAMTGRELDFGTRDFDEKWLILRMALGAEGMKGLDPAQFDERIRALTDKQKEKVELWCRDEDFNSKLWTDTEAAINDWYEQNTLLGALTHLDGRRDEMRAALRDRLIEMGLGVRDEEGNEKPFDVENDLRNEESEISRFLRSVEFNTYNFTWALAWSDFDGIRIYGRDGKDPERIRAFVFNQSSHMFFGRHIDHAWEFFVNERRGREAGEDEVNEIIRKMFPGKHHTLFPSNRTMVRFAPRFFISGDQWEVIRSKADDLMKQIDFKHPDPEYNGYFKSWAENVVTAEMFDNGELDFTAKNFSDTASLMRKYEMTDLFYDRRANLQYLSKENFQAYLANPTEGDFLRINNKETIFYSGRNFRLFPWMELALRAHWEIESKHSQRLFDNPNITAAVGEKLVDGLMAGGDMERQQAEHFKRKYFGLREIGNLKLPEIFGTTPFRRIRQNLEVIRRLTWESKFLPGDMAMSGIWEAIVAFFKQLPKELSR
ncbi:MAG: hypothetical protein HY377_02085 [Candidatus Blackburnbacteria bacterium]|nr:hypothetical protein [Candidatus Blackburnbacteria bacterium]